MEESGTKLTRTVMGREHKRDKDIKKWKQGKGFVKRKDERIGKRKDGVRRGRTREEREGKREDGREM